MTEPARYLIVTRGGDVIVSSRDRFRQLDGSYVAAADLHWGHTIPGRGRVLDVQPLAAAGRRAAA